MLLLKFKVWFRWSVRERSQWLISFSIIPNKLLLISSCHYFLCFFFSHFHTRAPSFILFIRHIFTLFTLFFFFFILDFFYQKRNEFETNNNNNDCYDWKIWMNMFCISFSRSLQTVTRFTRASAIACAHTERELKWNAELLHGVTAVLCLQIPKKKKKRSLPKWVATPHRSIAKPHTFRCGLSSMCFWWWFRHRFDDDDIVTAVVIVAIAITLSLASIVYMHLSVIIYVTCT